jgi:hypothetical protein
MKTVQRQTVLEQLKALENNTLSGFKPKKVREVTLLESPYTQEKFIRINYIDVLDDGSPVAKMTYTRIDENGHAHPHANKTMQFKTLEDKVHFFSTLQKIKL